MKQREDYHEQLATLAKDFTSELTFQGLDSLDPKWFNFTNEKGKTINLPTKDLKGYRLEVGTTYTVVEELDKEQGMRFKSISCEKLTGRFPGKIVDGQRGSHGNFMYCCKLEYPNCCPRVLYYFPEQKYISSMEQKNVILHFDQSGNLDVVTNATDTAYCIVHTYQYRKPSLEITHLSSELVSFTLTDEIEINTPIIDKYYKNGRFFSRKNIITVLTGVITNFQNTVTFSPKNCRFFLEMIAKTLKEKAELIAQKNLTTGAKGKAPIVEDTPIAENTSVVEEAPIVEDVPVMEDTSVVEDTSIAEDAPVVEDAPVINDSTPKKGKREKKTK